MEWRPHNGVLSKKSEKAVPWHHLAAGYPSKHDARLQGARGNSDECYGWVTFLGRWVPWKYEPLRQTLIVLRTLHEALC